MAFGRWFQLIAATNLALAALPLRAVRAAPAESASTADILQFTAGGHVVGFAPDGMYAATGTHSLHVDFVNANRVRPLSSTPAGGEGRIAALGRVVYAGLWDGIDLEYAADAEGIYETTYRTAPGADPADIRLRYNAPLVLKEDGTLAIAFQAGTLTESAPAAWQDIDGVRVPVAAAFRLDGQEVGFEIGAYDPAYPLTIDPSLKWNTFLGGSGNDTGAAIVLDADGNVFIAGSAAVSWGAPVRPFTGGEWDAFAAKFDSSGNPVWNTYLGGYAGDSAGGIALDSDGNIYVAGMSVLGWGSPVRGYSSGMDGFVAKLDGDGNLLWHTFLGGSGFDSGTDVLTAGTGILAVAGYSGATWGSPLRTFVGGGNDAFVVQLNSTTGALNWNTFLGGIGVDIGNRLARDFAGSIYVTGSSDATWGAPVRAYSAGNDAFAAKMDAATGSLTWMTFLGGSGADVGFSIAAATDGSNVYVSGDSDATWGGPLRAHSGDYDAFAVKLDPTGAVVWNTFLGGTDEDTGHGITVDGFGNIYVTGDSQASWGSPIRPYGAVEDAFLVKLSSAGSVTWSTFLGGDRSDTSSAVAYLWSGTIYVCGNSMDSWGSPAQAFTSGVDAFVAAVDSSGALQWNTFAGGSADDYGLGIDVDGSGNVYITGYGNGYWGYPYVSYISGNDAFVAKLDGDGNLEWNTFLGGSGEDRGQDIVVDSDGNVFVTGFSDATWGSPVRAFTGEHDAFVAKLDSAGNRAWHTFLGAGGFDQGESIALDASGNPYIAGISDSTWGAPVRPYDSDGDAFAAKLDPASGALTWNTFLGGGDGDYAEGIAVSSTGNVFVAGASQAAWGAPVRAYTAGYDGFVAQLWASTGTLKWNTFQGGSGEDQGTGVAVDAVGNAYTSGYSNSAWGTPVRDYAGGLDGYAVKIDSSGALLWSSFLGSGSTDFALDIAVNADGIAFVSGVSAESWGKPLRAYTGAGDAFVVRLTSPGALYLNTFLGGYGTDTAEALALDGNGDILAAGSSGALWETPVRWFSDGNDAFAAKVNLDPPGAFGKSGPADGSYVTTSPTLTWAAGSNADSYEYCFDTVDNDVCDASWENVGDGLIVGLGTVTNNRTYYWQVRAGNDAGETYADGGTWWSFTARNSTFADVPIDHPLWQYIEALYASGITTGCGVSPLIFCPENNVTRAAMAVFLLRAKYGSGYAPPPLSHYFADLPVPGKEWQEAWVDQFYREGITTGCGTSPLIYCPENPVTRAAMAVFILRTLEGPSYTPPAASHFFADMPVAGKEWMEPWVDELYRRGITTGCGTGPLIFCPENPVKRQAMAAFIVRAFNLPLP